MENQPPNLSSALSQTQAADSDSFTLRCRGCGHVESRRVTKATQRYRGSYLSFECRKCASDRRLKLFQKLCPAAYQQTDVNRLPPAQFAEIMAWQYGPTGLLLSGEPRKGKTRCSWQLIHRLMVVDRREIRIKFFDCGGFADAIEQAFKDETKHEFVREVSTVPLVFMDDFGKNKFTERVEMELFNMIDRRTANLLPLIVTTNDTGESLAARMSDNRGAGMIGRLREYCTCIDF